MMKIKNIALILSFTFSAGCGTMGKDMRNFFAGKKSSEPSQPLASTGPTSQNEAPTFSESKNIPVREDRQYKRMSKKQFEDGELFGDNSGSLWVMEGQDSYLFSENIVRLPGDMLNIVLEGQPEQQLSTKAQVIKDLTQKLEKKKRQLSSAVPNPADGDKKDPAAAAPGAKPAEGADKKDAKAVAAGAEDAAGEETSADTPFNVKEVPTRIVERLSDGNYRVKGSQSFMIGSREYKVIVTGLVRPSDVNQDRVDSTKLLDSKFDIVKNNRGKTL